MASASELVLIDGQSITTATTTNGTRYQLEDADVDPVGYAYVDAVSGTTPTCDITIQHSNDGTNWLDVASFTQVTTTDTALYKALLSSTIPALLKFVRAKVVTAGTNPSYVVTVKICYARSKV